MVSEEQVVGATKAWVEEMVIGQNLCPFAQREVLSNRVRYQITLSEDVLRLVDLLQIELDYLQSHADVATTLLVHPNVLIDFDEYNQFLNVCDDLLSEKQLEGEIQIASFHPDYQFADTQTDSPENFTNRSPYPILHLLRESDVSRAIQLHGSGRSNSNKQCTAHA